MLLSTTDWYCRWVRFRAKTYKCRLLSPSLSRASETITRRHLSDHRPNFFFSALPRARTVPLSVKKLLRATLPTRVVFASIRGAKFAHRRPSGGLGLSTDGRDDYTWRKLRINESRAATRFPIFFFNLCNYLFTSEERWICFCEKHKVVYVI